MNNKLKLTAKVVIILFLLAFLGYCAMKPDYKDIIKINEDIAIIMEDFSNGIQDINNSKKVIATMYKFIDEVEKTIPRMNKIKEKYPDLFTKQKGNQELFNSFSRKAQATSYFFQSFVELQDYNFRVNSEDYDPSVMEAWGSLVAAKEKLHNFGRW